MQINKWLHILKWLLLLAYLIFILGFTNKKKEAVYCTDFVINIRGPHKFINEEIVKNLLINNDINIDSCIIDNINFEKTEKILEAHPAVLNSEIYSDFKGNVQVDILQKEPLVRVITSANNSFYIDSDGNKLPLSEHYTAHVPIVSGNIDKMFIESLENKEVAKSSNYNYDFSMKELIRFVQYLKKHDLWKYQIIHIYLTKNNEIELVPRLGDHVLKLGTLENYKYKLEKLEIFYKTTFSDINWDLISCVDLRYSDQVILKKR